MRTIFGLVGPTGSGKTTLILEILKRFPNRIAVAKSFTTRLRRGDDDDIFYTFITREDMEAFRSDPARLVQISEYAGNLYANGRTELETLLAEKFGITALVETGVNNLRQAGYSVTVIKILPFHNPSVTDEQRKQADEERAKSHLPAELIINNSFEAGGLEKSVERLAEFIEARFQGGG